MNVYVQVLINLKKENMKILITILLLICPVLVFAQTYEKVGDKAIKQISLVERVYTVEDIDMQIEEVKAQIEEHNNALARLEAIKAEQEKFGIRDKTGKENP